MCIIILHNLCNFFVFICYLFLYGGADGNIKKITNKTDVNIINHFCNIEFHIFNKK